MLNLVSSRNRSVITERLTPDLLCWSIEAPFRSFVFFRTIPPLSPANIVRGQFEGYREEPGVAQFEILCTPAGDGARFTAPHGV